MTDDTPIRVLLVDDHQLVRAGFRLMVEVEDDIEVVGEAATGAEGIQQALELRPHVVLMDVQMPEMDGIKATRQITSETDSVVLMLTTFGDEDNVLACLQAGANGFLLKNTDPAQLVAAVRSAAAGHWLLAPEVTRHVMHNLSGDADGSAGEQPERVAPEITASSQAALDLLTAREIEVLQYVAGGLSNGEIAQELVVGEATVKSHVSACLSKLHFRDRVQLVVFAFESGFMDQVRRAN